MTDQPNGKSIVLEDIFRQQLETVQSLLSQAVPGISAAASSPADMQHWAMSAAKLQKMWLDYSADQAGRAEPALAKLFDPAKLGTALSGWIKLLPLDQAQTQARLWEESLDLWTDILGQYGIGPQAHEGGDAQVVRLALRIAALRHMKAAMRRSSGSPCASPPSCA